MCGNVEQPSIAARTTQTHICDTEYERRIEAEVEEGERKETKRKK